MIFYFRCPVSRRGGPGVGSAGQPGDAVPHQPRAAASRGARGDLLPRQAHRPRRAAGRAREQD